MATSGTLNVVCHGSIVFVVGSDGEIELLLPRIDSEWDHRYEAGTWAGDRLVSIEAGEEFRLAGVQTGDGKQRFDPKVNIVIEGPLPPLDGKELRRFRLPPPTAIYSANYIPISPADTFEKPDDRRVAGMQRLSTLSVLAYECDDLSAAKLLTDGGHDFRWLPEIISNGGQAVNLHIFAEPWTFRPLETGRDFPTAPLPFNALLDSVGGDQGLTMLPPASSGGAFFASIDPGAPIPGLPEPEKLALSRHSQMVRYGLSHNLDHPFNCGQLVVQSGAGKQPTPSKHAFAILQNKKPMVLADPHVAVIYWGSATIDPEVDAKVQQLLELDFLKSALAEYGVNPPQFVGSVANPKGSKTVMEDTERVLTTPERSAIAGGLNDLILAGKIPDPRQDPNLLYLIVAAPGARSATVGVRGSHNYFYLEIPGGDQGGARVPVRYAWALQKEIRGLDLTALDNLTWTLSHELLEACTDPEPPSGYVFQGTEICDIAAGLHGRVDGIEVTGYFSNKEGAYKTPDSRAVARSA